MLKGVYTAASGMIANSKAINAVGNNMANASTAGYKKETVLFTSFGDAMTYRVNEKENAAVGNTSNGVVAGQVHTGYGQSPLEATNRGLDLAIEGEGFFTVRLGDGALALTRNGGFQVDAAGYLVDGMNHRVLGTDGDLRVGTSSFTVAGDGTVSADGNVIGRLRITCPTDTAALTKLDGGLFTGFQQQAAFTGKIHQGALETSGLELTEEVTHMIASSRAFQSCSQLVKMMDGVLEKSVNEIGRV